MPISLPGMGKSYFLNVFIKLLEKYPNFNFGSVSSDATRYELM
jgi:hypothetical protein